MHFTEFNILRILYRGTRDVLIFYPTIEPAYLHFYSVWKLKTACLLFYRNRFRPVPESRIGTLVKSRLCKLPTSLSVGSDTVWTAADKRAWKVPNQAHFAIIHNNKPLWWCYRDLRPIFAIPYTHVHARITLHGSIIRNLCATHCVRGREHNGQIMNTMILCTCWQRARGV